MRIVCSKCKYDKLIKYKKRPLSNIRDATVVTFICPSCSYKWMGRLYWRTKYDNVSECEKGDK